MASTRNKEKLKKEFESLELTISQEVEKLPPEDLFANENSLPSFSEDDNSALDYKQQLIDIHNESQNIIDNLAELYLGDEKLLDNPYISEKRRKDAEYFSKLQFLVELSTKTLMSMMRELDMGNTNVRMFEVQSMLQKEMRDNIKFASTTLKSVETFYKSLRDDLGITQTPLQSEEQQENNTQQNFKNLNDTIDSLIGKHGDSLNFDVDDDDDDD
jgi:hypothetical protein